MNSDTNKCSLKRFFTVVVFGIAFAYIESSVVVYLRALFYKDGFTFPIADFGTIEGFKPFLLTEIGREAATLVLILTSSMLIGNNFRKRFAYFLVIFAVWDIFYYVWLKVLIGWPASIMDWDVLFLIPVTWAGPVLAPVATSLTMIIVAIIMLQDRPMKISPPRAAGYVLSIIMTVVTFCIAGQHCTEPDYKSYFPWTCFLVWHVLIIILTLRCIAKK